ncbi:MAG: sugar ABC transporter substrate-binding protein [Lachnospiraceae bacterium]|nr:sugar ABC transporter substrate-binding protein [Lachnospiraceae bacterium]MDD3616061.1 sugar ABC transporter substrate-binding protein [Lachnospiraceae bacterium]
MRLKKAVAMGLGLTVAATTVLAGCGSSKDSSTTADGKANLSVFIFANDHESEIYNKMFEEYKEAHSDTINDIDVQITTQDEYSTTLTGMMTAGDLPDIFYVGPESVKEFVDNGYIENLQPYLDKAGITTEGLSAQEALNSYRYDGSQTGSGDIYALPKDASVFAYAYNKDMFDEAGIPYPDPENPYTYDEFVEVCKQFTKDTDGDGEIDQWGCGTADTFMMYQYIWSNGASFLSDDHKTVTIDTPEFKEAVQKYVDLTLTHKVTPTVEQDTSLGVYQRWLAGQEAFYACGTWDVAAFEDKETFPFNWDLCGYPTLSTGVSQTWLGTVGFCVSANSENKEIATDLVSYLSTDEEGQKELSGITTGESIQLPNITSLTEGEFLSSIESGDLAFPSNVDVFFNYLGGTDKYAGKFMETTYTPNSEWMDLFFEGFANVKNGSTTVDDYIAQVQPQMQAALDSAWADAE